MSLQCYRLIVKGEIGARDAAAFEGTTISAHGGVTETTGTMIDGSRLQNLLVRIAGLALTVISLTVIESEERSRGTCEVRSSGLNRS